LVAEVRYDPIGAQKLLEQWKKKEELAAKGIRPLRKKPKELTDYHLKTLGTMLLQTAACSKALHTIAPSINNKMSALKYMATPRLVKYLQGAEKLVLLSHGELRASKELHAFASVLRDDVFRFFKRGDEEGDGYKHARKLVGRLLKARVLTEAEWRNQWENVE